MPGLRDAGFTRLPYIRPRQRVVHDLAQADIADDDFARRFRHRRGAAHSRAAAPARIPTTWFIPGHTIESYPASVRAVADAGHEIGNHGWTHRIPATLGRDGEEQELVRGNAAIKALTGRKPRGYRSPSWDLSPHSVDLLLKHGFLYDSSMMGHDIRPTRHGATTRPACWSRCGPARTRRWWRCR